VHPAHRQAYQALGYLVTADNTKFTRAEDLARWGQAVTQAALGNPEWPELPSLIMGSVKPRKRLGPEIAAIQEALAHADQATEREQLVMGFVCTRRGTHGRRLAVIYAPDFVATCTEQGNGPEFGSELVLADNTVAAFERHLQRGWIPVAVACGDDSPLATFLPVHAGLGLTAAAWPEVIEQGMAAITALLARMRE